MIKNQYAQLKNEKMDGMPELDAESLADSEAQQAAKRQEREARMAQGVDDRIVMPEGALDPSLVKELDSAQREARWGFTHDELRCATKVVAVLFNNPHLFVGDPVLADTRLYTMVSRDRKTKRENRQTYTALQNEERSRRAKSQRQADVNTMMKTQMRQQRDAALNALLAPVDALTANDNSDMEEDSARTRQIANGPAVAQTAQDEQHQQQQQQHASTAAAAASASAAANSAVRGDGEEKDEGDEGERAGMRMNRLQKCHTCKQGYDELHPFYYALCPPCGEFNFAKRTQTRDLRGKVVLLTGCRIKIGYAMALSLLRCGAILVGTTRFSHDAVARFSQESDYGDWKERLHLFSLDMRDLWMVTQFCGFLLKSFPSLFAIINNAAQTIARTPQYTEVLRRQEAHPSKTLQTELLEAKPMTREWVSFFAKNSSVVIGQGLQLEHHPQASQALPSIYGEADCSAAPATAAAAVAGEGPTEAGEEVSVTTVLSHGAGGGAERPSKDGGVVSGPRPLRDGERVKYDLYDTFFEASDLREHNSWTTNLGDVTGGEAAEVMAINALAPLIINSKLKPALMRQTPVERAAAEKRFIINVSAMEGQFYRFKQTTHPHTNMAKAALNMMTRTSAADYVKDGIFMNSVDTGWITDESPLSKKQRRANDFMQCPLDEIDAAARCLDLIYSDSSEVGQFWKDFHPIPW